MCALEAGQEAVRFPESDKVFILLKEMESSCPVNHLVVGGIGVAGVLEREIRQADDLDVLIREEDQEEMVRFLDSLGFKRLSQEEEMEIMQGAGFVMKRNDGLRVDVALANFSEDGATIRFPEGRLFIPEQGLGFETNLRGITFKTFSPEVHYFFKNRATRRHPLKTIWPLNRPKDVKDYEALRAVVDAKKAQSLLDNGFSYKGRHPLPRMFKQGLLRRIRQISKHGQG